MKKLKSLLVLAFMAMGFYASAQTIIVINTTPYTIDMALNITGCSPGIAMMVPPGVTPAFPVCTAPIPGGFGTFAMWDTSCVPPVSKGTGFSLSCNVVTPFPLCVGTILFEYDCASNILRIN